MTIQGGPLYYEDLQVGQRWISPARTVTETDVVQFAGLTGDFTPLHVDHEFARQTPFGRPIAHGLLGLSMMAGLSSTCPWVQTAALLEVRGWKFLKPIFFGDTIHVETEIAACEPSGRRRGRVIWIRRLRNQHGEVLQEGELVTLVLAARPQPAPSTIASHATSSQSAAASHGTAPAPTAPPPHAPFPAANGTALPQGKLEAR